ncbi:MAG: ABC transporter ATP-binding protein [Trebonia sp.]
MSRNLARPGPAIGENPVSAGSMIGQPDALRLVSVSKVYDMGRVRVPALHEVSVRLAAGSFTAVMGPSGSGKSTLLHCASGLDHASSGEVYVGGERMPAGDEAELARFRRGRVGFVFQQFNLLPVLTVLQNVMLPARIAGARADVREARAVLDRVGLADRVNHRPAELSGGEQQRVAIARALVTRPRLLFADEPTGALDIRRAAEVLALLGEAVRGYGQTVVMVTHDAVAAAHADSVLFLADGRIVDRLSRPDATAVAERMTALTAQAASAALAGKVA